MTLRPLWHQHPHVRSGKQLLFRERAADLLKRVFGTWSILGVVALIIAVWITTSGFGIDAMPYILLNLGLSCLAAVQGIILQIAANRGDRQSSELALSTHAHGEQLLTMNQQQLEILNELRELRALLNNADGAPIATPPLIDVNGAMTPELADQIADRYTALGRKLRGGG
jgi:uncharacterized membrane protein